MQDSPLAGFLYHAGEELWPQIREGDVLRMVREPDSPRNAKGVRVEWRDRKIGYVPRRRKPTWCASWTAATCRRRA